MDIQAGDFRCVKMSWSASFNAVVCNDFDIVLLPAGRQKVGRTRDDQRDVA
jgi:malate/lactate dehydrogenase